MEDRTETEPAMWYCDCFSNGDSFSICMSQMNKYAFKFLKENEE